MSLIAATEIFGEVRDGACDHRFADTGGAFHEHAPRTVGVCWPGEACLSVEIRLRRLDKQG